MMKDFHTIMRKNIFTLILCITAALNISAQGSAGNGTLTTHSKVMTDNYDFWLYTPKSSVSGSRTLPLVFYLHGASCCGTDLEKVRSYGTVDALSQGMSIPAIVIAPQSQTSWSPKKLNDLLEWAKRNLPIDESRVYVLGMSLGGYGTMDFVNAYPEKIAAAIAFCGGCSAKQPDGLGKTCLWIMHATADTSVDISCSKQVVSYLQGKGKDKLLRYEWMEGGSHSVYARYFYLQKTYDWLFLHSLRDRPRQVNRTFSITNDDVSNSYSGYSSQSSSGYTTQPSSGYTTQPSSGYTTQPNSGYTTQPGYVYPEVQTEGNWRHATTTPTTVKKRTVRRYNSSRRRRY